MTFILGLATRGTMIRPWADRVQRRYAKAKTRGGLAPRTGFKVDMPHYIEL
jgi:hypothetical protein